MFHNTVENKGAANAPSNEVLLCGTHRGSIYVIRTPLANATNGIFHYLAHSARVTHVRILFYIRFY